MPVYVASASEAAALDAVAIAGGIPSRALMRVASANATTIISQWSETMSCGNGTGTEPESHRKTVLVLTGPGNNGGDGWCVARGLAQSGMAVTVCEVAKPKTADAVAERALALPFVTRITSHEVDTLRPHIVVDALLGTGATGSPRGEIAKAVHAIATYQADCAQVVALDVPTGLDATTGVYGETVVHADLTITFGTCKRGHLTARNICGEIVVTDLGFLADREQRLPRLVDSSWIAPQLPHIAFDAHKGTRKKLVIVAGGQGMGGAAMLAAEGALHSGIGLVKVVTQRENIEAVHVRVPSVLTSPFPVNKAERQALVDWGDALLIGPGLGHGQESRELIESILNDWHGPLVLDADALNVFDGDCRRLARYTRRRPSVITPHPAEFARLVTSTISDVLDRRFDIGISLAQQLGAAVLLKGTPTIITSADGGRYVSAAGTPALGTGGSGDMLGGMIATLLAQGNAPHIAATCAAWVHGRAAELCGPSVRGITLNEILVRLGDAWRDTMIGDTRSTYPFLLELPRVE